jgi:hypothetical protein
LRESDRDKCSDRKAACASAWGHFMIGSGVTGSLFNEVNNLEGSRDSDRGAFFDQHSHSEAEVEQIASFDRMKIVCSRLRLGLRLVSESLGKTECGSNQ